jgi:hypothetical protein
MLRRAEVTFALGALTIADDDTLFGVKDADGFATNAPPLPPPLDPPVGAIICGDIFLLRPPLIKLLPIPFANIGNAII